MSDETTVIEVGDTLAPGQAEKLPSGTRVRLTPKGVVHTVWGTHTVCHRAITDEAEVVEANKGLPCRRCNATPVVTFTFASGARRSYYVR